MSPSQQPRPLRVGFDVSSMRIGGAELRALRLAEHLPRDRFELDFLAYAGAGLMDQRARDAGARVHYVGGESVSASPLPVRAAARLAKLARYSILSWAAQYDIINAWLYPGDVYTVLARPLTRTPVIVAGRFDLLPRDWFGPFSTRIDAYVNRRVDAVVANSERVATFERERASVDPRKLHVIRNGVEPVTPIGPAERRRIRSEYGADDSHILIGSVGMLREVKRHDLLVDAFADVARARADVRLVIAGDGPMRGPLERQVDRLGLDDRVVLPGAIADIRPLLDAFDLVTLSSRSEGLPNALLEAAAAGKPVVTTAAGGATETVDDGVSGLVVPVDDRAALAAALLRLASDPELRQRFGAAGRQYVETNFGMERYIREWGSLYERLAIAKGLIKG